MIINLNFLGGQGGGDTPSMKYEVVTELPQEGKEGVIYLAPSKNPQEKDVYIEYIWVKDLNTFEQFGEKIDLEDYYTKEETNDLLDNKQDKLVSGTNIKTINGEDILGEGDIEIKGDTIKAGDGIYISEDAEGAKVISTSMPKNEIWYTTSNGLTAQTTNSTGLASLNTMGLVSNTYVDGKGVMKFSKDVTSIGERAFENCSSLTSVEIPDSVTIIGNYAFNYCRSIISIEIPNSVTSIGNCAFENCSNLTSVNMGDGVKTINDRAFYACQKLNRINSDVDGIAIMPKELISITGSPFYNFSNFTTLIFNEKLYYNNGLTAFGFCDNLTSVTIPNTVVLVKSGAWSKLFQSIPTEGTLYCDEDWFNNLTSSAKEVLANVANWTRKPLPKSIEERVDELENNKVTLTATLEDGSIVNYELLGKEI